MLKLLAAAVVEDEDELTRALFAGARRFPGYRAVSDHELGRNLRFVTRCYLDVLVDNEQPDTPDRLQAMFYDRLVRGTSLRDLMDVIGATGEVGYFRVNRAGYRLGLRTIDEQDAVARAGLRIVAFTRRLEELAAAAAAAIETRPSPGSAAAFVAQALERPPEQVDLLRGEAARLGLPARGRYWGILCVVPRHGADLLAAKALAETIATATGAGPLSLVRLEPVPHAVALVAAETAEQWCEAIRQRRDQAHQIGAEVLPAPKVSEVSHLRRAYNQLTPLLRYVAVLPLADDPAVLRLYRDADARLPVERVDIFNRDLGALVREPDGPELIAAVDAMWIAGGAQNVGGRVLGVAQGTMSQRRQRVHSVTGLDWSRRHDWLVIAQGDTCRLLAAAFDVDFEPDIWGPSPDFAALSAAAAAIRTPPTPPSRHD